MNPIHALPHARLERLGSIVVTGADAHTFLQGQLSFDISRMIRERMTLACCNSSQGRVQSVLWLVQRSDALLMLLPAALTDLLLVRLRKYVLRAKVKLADGSGQWTVFDGGEADAAHAPLTHQELDHVSYLIWPGTPPRVLILAPTHATAPLAATGDADWQLADIRAGLPQVYPQTHEMFVAQMLNIDLLGGISFDKGCYTGQEIIARTHYRGAIKRRMFRFQADCPPPPPGSRIVVEDQHAGDVVDAAATPQGCELLAVISLAQLDSPLRLALEPTAALRRLALPYAVTAA